MLYWFTVFFVFGFLPYLYLFVFSNIGELIQSKLDQTKLD